MVVLTGARGEAGPDGGIGWGCGGRGSFGGGEANGGGRLARRRLQRRRAATGGVEKAAAAGVIEGTGGSGGKRKRWRGVEGWFIWAREGRTRPGGGRISRRRGEWRERERERERDSNSNPSVAGCTREWEEWGWWAATWVRGAEWGVEGGGGGRRGRLGGCRLGERWREVEEGADRAREGNFRA
uniref:Uncharacterized protein n=1 Tax=Oryza sativa subsp. japonica TaxID=39947 RepID=Q6H5L5_ORYSJ|nr:hypothetical protein [Oryza sativa Japonica Group]BAD25984.1 hypothetical protein [Oryza sativa Japonica Group]